MVQSTVGEKFTGLIPELIKDAADSRRLNVLENTETNKEFFQTLKKFANRTQPIWIYGMPHTGSTWFCKRFMGAFCDETFNEPKKTTGCNSLNHSETHLNLNSDQKTIRPKIQRVLGLTDIPLDRLIFSVVPKFSFKLLYDFTLVPELVGLYPQSKFVWLSRDGRDIVESFHNPSDDSWPEADFEFLGEDKEQRFKEALKRFIRFSRT